MRYSFPFSNTAGVDSVVSSSLANLALFLSASVPSASAALFPKGPDGNPGPTVFVPGIPGPDGGVGPTGPSGLNVLVISGSRAKCGGTCYQVTNTDSINITLVSWTSVDGASQNDNLDPSDTVYLCSLTTPVIGTGTVSAGATGCPNLVTTIAEAKVAGGVCEL